MSFNGVILQVITKVEPLVPVMLFCAGVTLVLMLILYFLSGNVWMDDKRFKVLGVFFGLSRYDCYRLALSWIRLLMTLFFVVAFRNLKLETNLRQVIRSPQFVAYLLIGVLYALDIKRPVRIPKNICWFLVISCGLFATSIVCGYMQTLAGFNLGVFIVYVFMGMFMILFALYLFLMEMDEVSKDRVIDPEKEYAESVRANEE